MSASKTAADTWISISFRTKHETAWAGAGHEVAWTQHPMHASKESIATVSTSSGSSALQVRASRTAWTIGNGNFEIVFDRSRGMLQSWTSGGQELLLADSVYNGALVPGFWRSPTDNDRPRDDIYWKRFGLDILTSQLRDVAINRISQDEVEVIATTFLSPPVLDWGYEARLTYHFTANETLSIKAKLTPLGKIPETLPRIGLDLRLSKTLVNADYVGLGPGESYPDKMAAQKMGRYSSAVADLPVSYDVPQENGTRMGARWVKLAEDGGLGLQVTRKDGEASFSWAAGYHTPHALDKARHPCDLTEEDALLLKLDIATAGVGSGACGPGIGKDVQVPCEATEFEFVMQKVMGR